MTGGSASLLGAVWQLIQYLFLFGLVLVLAYASTRGLRRLASPGRGRHLRLLDQLHLGNNRSFYLIALAGRVVLVAMGEGGVAAVTTLDDPNMVAELLKQPEGASGAPNFAQLLRSAEGAAGPPQAESPQEPPVAAAAGAARLQAQVARLRRLVEKAEA